MSLPSHNMSTFKSLVLITIFLLQEYKSTSGWLFVRKSDIRRARERMQRAREMVILHTEIFCIKKCWDGWSEWSACGGPCNSGYRKRTRVANPPANCKGIPCRGDSVEKQRCHINCGIGGIGHGFQSRCICKIGWYGQCCLQRHTCHRPRKPQNGVISGSLRWPAFYSTVITYTCNEGHRINGPHQRTCTLEGKWTGKKPTCNRITCTKPDNPTNGRVVNERDEYLYKDTIGYECDLGYQLKGVSSRQCTSSAKTFNGRWTAFTPTCTPKICLDPGVPRHSKREGDSLLFGSQLLFSCERGFQLMGSKQRKCLSSEEWSGSQPKCVETLCQELKVPTNGFVKSSQNTLVANVDTTFVFFCNPGYAINGNSVLTCLDNGKWNGSEPRCAGILCPDPGWPSHGTREESSFLYGQSVIFSCYDGYILQGERNSTCQEDKTWTFHIPACQACPKNTYSDGNNCTSCPPNSYSLTPATQSRKQCICNRGYKGPYGGPCQELSCPYPETKEFGLLILSCNTKFDEECRFDCVDGYIVNEGSLLRKCTESGRWDGSMPTCRACPINTFKATSGSCLPCPPNSHTYRDGSIKADCICNIGFKGKECSDVNECEANIGRGSCQQTCHNNVGSYTCGCDIPGYILAEDGHNCQVEKQCQNLTAYDAPDHGGLICHWYTEENSQQCTVKCNPGYELPARINSYETCGPSTGYQWSYKRTDKEATLNPCIEEFFPDFRFEAESAYFVRDCNLLTPEERNEVKEKFAKRLTDEGVCFNRKTKVCLMRNVGIICSKVTRRRRGIQEIVDRASISFQVVANKVEDKSKNCGHICKFLKIPTKYCDRVCLRAYKRFLKAAVQYAKMQVKKLYQDPVLKIKAKFRAASQIFEPADEAKLGNIITDCSDGMEFETKKGMCVPCSAGSYKSPDSHCRPCPAGTYQDKNKMTECISCPLGTYTQTNGSRMCTPCKRMRYGLQCEGICDCIHGDCDVKTGLCKCHSGWEGQLCNIDIPGCRRNGCFQNVTCLDIPAPGFGYRCDTCPINYTGNGILCSKFIDTDKMY